MQETICDEHVRDKFCGHAAAAQCPNSQPDSRPWRRAAGTVFTLHRFRTMPSFLEGPHHSSDVDIRKRAICRYATLLRSAVLHGRQKTGREG